ncbi:MAG: hypothetical protein A3J31_00540 [Candidatus Taylorbacteria bacterium RIFCSPLOWO2_02_FULL_48_16]|nr:MAG: hypothetical protein A3J31_00540 [Candidatus Taylorbacteria bacterium RIFCSPLOWO2_02_FULL_48_16]
MNFIEETITTNKKENCMRFLAIGLVLYACLLGVIKPESDSAKNIALAVLLCLFWILGAIGLCFDAAQAEKEKSTTR